MPYWWAPRLPDSDPVIFHPKFGRTSSALLSDWGRWIDKLGEKCMYFSAFLFKLQPGTKGLKYWGRLGAGWHGTMNKLESPFDSGIIEFQNVLPCFTAPWRESKMKWGLSEALQTEAKELKQFWRGGYFIGLVLLFFSLSLSEGGSRLSSPVCFYCLYVEGGFQLILRKKATCKAQSPLTCQWGSWTLMDVSFSCLFPGPISPRSPSFSLY